MEDYQKALNYNYIPLETLQLSALLKEKLKVKTQIIDLRHEERKYKNKNLIDPDKGDFKKFFLNVLEKKNYEEFENVAIIFDKSYQYLQVNFIAKILKEISPAINLIVGGYHPTAVPEDFMYKNSPYDFVLIGETELSILELFKSNLLLRNSDKKPKLCRSEKIIDLDSLYFPDYANYLANYPFKDFFNFEISMSRGCAFECTFCPCKIKPRNHTIDVFLEHFKKLIPIVESYNKKAPKINFIDRSFNSASISKKVLNFIIKHELSERLKFSCQTRIEIVSKYRELVELFRKSNMIVGFGFESANNDLLLEMRKTKRPDKYKESIKTIVKLYNNARELYFRLNILVGFPGETKKTFFETINFINDYALRDFIQIGPTLFSNFPNTYVYHNMKYYEKKFGSEFLKNWWKIPGNPHKNSILNKPSKNYAKKEMVSDYLNAYTNILKQNRYSSFYSFENLIIWKKYFRKWESELASDEPFNQ
ncbi:MAG: B12-binding domain-containing radical SAM protein [Promethearchaeota archaeon]